MFYGGDAVDLVLIVLLCAEWYRVTGRNKEDHNDERSEVPARLAAAEQVVLGGLPPGDSDHGGRG